MLNTKRKIVITGATGFIGRKLCRTLFENGNDITVFSRNINMAKRVLPYLYNFVEWDYRNPRLWQNELENKDAVIHLAGTNVFGKRWDANYKHDIYESRESATRNLVNSISVLKNKPEVFISSSAVGYYGDYGNEPVTEDSDPGNDFLAGVCKAWEYEASLVENSGIRRVSIRTGIIISPEDGALKKMLLPFRFFAGGPLGNGNQWFPWIHIEDILRIYLFALDNDKLQGPVNGTAPNPVTMKEFAKTLGRVLNRPSIFHVPEFLLKLTVGEGALTILASQKVIPQKLAGLSFNFNYEFLEPALTSFGLHYF
jgi:hypothetical protein